MPFDELKSGDHGGDDPHHQNLDAVANGIMSTIGMVSKMESVCPTCLFIKIATRSLALVAHVQEIVVVSGEKPEISIDEKQMSKFMNAIAREMIEEVIAIEAAVRKGRAEEC